MLRILHFCYNFSFLVKIEFKIRKISEEESLKFIQNFGNQYVIRLNNLPVDRERNSNKVWPYCKKFYYQNIIIDQHCNDDLSNRLHQNTNQILLILLHIQGLGFVTLSL